MRKTICLLLFKLTLFTLIAITAMNGTIIHAATVIGGSYPSCMIQTIEVEGYEIGFQPGVYHYYVTLPEGTTQVPKIQTSWYGFIAIYTFRSNNYIPPSVPGVACISYTLGVLNPYPADVLTEQYYIHFNVGQVVTTAPVTASPASGAVEAGTAVTLSSATQGANIYYFVNGSSQRLTYKNPIIIDQNISISAYATKAGMNNSETKSFTYTLQTNPQDPFSGGTGLSGKPYIITTAEQLAKLAELVNNQDAKFVGKYYQLGNDIDLSNYGAGFNGGKGWIPIGNIGANFVGGFDGAGYKITGLYINDPTRRFAGLFGSFGGIYYVSTLQNLSIENANITASSTTGIIAGKVSNGNITNCSVSGTVSGYNQVGGIIGELYSSYEQGSNKAWIANCYSSASVYSNYDIAGGIVGEVAGGNPDALINCASLSPSVTLIPYQSTNTNAGRVVGKIGSAKLSGARALNSMKVTINGVDKTLVKGLDKIDGADMTMQNALTATYWTNPTNWGGKGWDPKIWEIKDGKLPVLRRATKLGDANGDGFVTAYDAVVILQIVAGSITPNENQMTACKMSSVASGITAFDAVSILQYIAGINTGYSIGEPVSSN